MAAPASGTDSVTPSAWVATASQGTMPSSRRQNSALRRAVTGPSPSAASVRPSSWRTTVSAPTAGLELVSGLPSTTTWPLSMIASREQRRSASSM